MKVTLLCFIAGALFNFAPSSADAGNKVHRKTAKQEVVAEIFVTSW